MLSQEHVAGAVMCEVPDSCDLHAGRDRAEIDAPGPVTILHEPLRGLVSIGVVPKDVTSAVAGEIADSSDLPSRPGNCPDVDAPGPMTVRHFPNVSFPGVRIEP